MSYTFEFIVVFIHACGGVRRGVQSGAVCLSVWCFVFVVWVELCSACV